jgi:cysteine desulfurase
MDTYLDYNATTPLRPEVLAAMSAAAGLVGNASSVHRFGRLARRAVEDARESVAALAGAAPANVIFTSGGTEANNLALRGSGRPVLASAVEHESVLAAVDDTPVIAVDGDGIVDLDALAYALEKAAGPMLVSVMLANNETGALQPVAAAAALAHRHGALLHCDAVQAAGRLPLDIAELGADLLTLSAHKIGGPQGIGALLLARDLPLDALLRGGGQERSRRAGTENVAGITGFGIAARLAADAIADMTRLAGIRDDIEARVIAAGYGAGILGAGAARLANTSCIGLPGVRHDTQVMALDLAGVAVSAGSACSSGKMAPSHVLRAMGCDDEAASNAIRLSLGWRSTPADADRFVSAWTDMAHRLASETDLRRTVA